MEFDELSKRVIGCSIEVHHILGPDLLESTYEQCLAHELTEIGTHREWTSDNFQYETPEGGT
jgi:GxxExxY protein